MSDILVVTNDTFSSEVLNSDIPVLVDFSAVWCGPCQRQLSVLKDFAKKYDGSIKVCKVDIDDNPELTSTYRIRSVPTLVLFDQGKPIHTKVGLSTLSVMEDMLTLLESSK